MDKVALGKFADGNEGPSLVIFGAGYVGGEAARVALARGWRVTALTRNAEKARALAAAGVRAIVAELAADAWHGEISRADFVVNCVSAGGGGTEGYRRSYVEGMRSVLAWLGACEAGAARGFVYTSSTSVYPQSGGALVRECDETGGDERARILLESERLALAGGACVLRLAGIYGPGRHLLLDQLRAGARELAGHGDYRLNLIHRDDAVRAIFAALEGAHGLATGAASSREIFNVCDDGAATRAEVAGWLAERLGVAMPSFTGGAAGGRRAAPLDRVICNEKIKTRLAWRPNFASFREGYEALLRR